MESKAQSKTTGLRALRDYLPKHRRVQDVPNTDPSFSTLGKSGTRPLTIFDLPAEIHLEIASYLPSSAIAILGSVSGLRNIYHVGRPLKLTPVELGYARELITRTKMERIITPHINKKKNIFDPASLNAEEVDQLLKCRLVCIPCGEDYPLTHFPVREIVEGMKRWGHAKATERKCIGICRRARIHWGRKGDAKWAKLEATRQELLRKVAELDEYGGHPVEPVLHTDNAATPLPPPDQNRRLMVDVHSLNPRPGKAKSSKYGLGIFFPDPYIRLHAQPYGGSISNYVSYLHSESHAHLASGWSSSLRKNLKGLGILFFVKFLVLEMCPHMYPQDLLIRQEPLAEDIGGSMFNYLVTGLHSNDLPWEDVLFENGEVVKKVKRMVSTCRACYKGGCETEVVLSRVMYRARKGEKRAGGNADVQGNGQDKNRTRSRVLGWSRLGNKGGEQWKQFVMATVKRRWTVTTPSSKEWLLQSGFSAERTKNNGGWGNLVFGPPEHVTSD